MGSAKTGIEKKTKTDYTRERILQIAERCFTEHGLFEISMIDLTKEIGISRTSLYRYYRDKLSLSLAILDKVIGDLHQAIDFDIRNYPDKTGLELTEMFIRAYWLDSKFINRYRYMAEFDSFYSGSRIPEGFPQSLEEVLRAHRSTVINQCLERGIKDGSIRPDIDVHLTARTVFISVRNMHHQVIIRNELLVQMSKTDRTKLVDTLLSILMRGIKADGGSNPRQHPR